MASIGPFVLAQYQPAQRIVFERNPRYWRKDDARRPTALCRSPDASKSFPIRTRKLRPAAVGTDRLHAAPVARGRHRDAAAARSSRSRSRSSSSASAPDADAFVVQPAAGRSGRRTRAAAWIARKEFRQAHLARGRPRSALPTPCSLARPCRSTDRSRRATAAGSGPASRATSSRATRPRRCSRASGWRNRDEDEWLEDAEGNRGARSRVLTFPRQPGARAQRRRRARRPASGRRRARRRAARDQRGSSSASWAGISRPRFDAVHSHRSGSGDVEGLLAQLRRRALLESRAERRRRPTGSARSTS